MNPNFFKQNITQYQHNNAYVRLFTKCRTTCKIKINLKNKLTLTPFREATLFSSTFNLHGRDPSTVKPKPCGPHSSKAVIMDEQ